MAKIAALLVFAASVAAAGALDGSCAASGECPANQFDKFGLLQTRLRVQEVRDVGAVPDKSERLPQEEGRSRLFTVDKGSLRSKARGLHFCSSKQAEDEHPLYQADWGSTIEGVPEGDWLRVRDLFLPMRLHDHAVLLPVDAAAAAAAAGAGGGDNLHEKAGNRSDLVDLATGRNAISRDEDGEGDVAGPSPDKDSDGHACQTDEDCERDCEKHIAKYEPAAIAEAICQGHANDAFCAPEGGSGRNVCHFKTFSETFQEPPSSLLEPPTQPHALLEEMALGEEIDLKEQEQEREEEEEQDKLEAEEALESEGGGKFDSWPDLSDQGWDDVDGAALARGPGLLSHESRPHISKRSLLTRQTREGDEALLGCSGCWCTITSAAKCGVDTITNCGSSLLKVCGYTRRRRWKGFYCSMESVKKNCGQVAKSCEEPMGFSQCFSSILGGVSGAFKNFLDLIKNSGCSSFGDCKTKLLNGIDAMFNEVQKLWLQMRESIEEMVQQGHGALVNEFKKAGNGIAKVVDQVKTKMSAIGQKAVKVVKGELASMKLPFKNKRQDGSLCLQDEGSGFWYMKPTDCGAFEYVGKVFTDGFSNGWSNFNEAKKRFGECLGMKGLFNLPTPFLELKTFSPCIPKSFVTPLEYFFGMLRKANDALGSAANFVYEKIKGFLQKKLGLGLLEGRRGLESWTVLAKLGCGIPLPGLAILNGAMQPNVGWGLVVEMGQQEGSFKAALLLDFDFDMSVFSTKPLPAEVKVGCALGVGFVPRSPFTWDTPFKFVNMFKFGIELDLNYLLGIPVSGKPTLIVPLGPVGDIKAPTGGAVGFKVNLGLMQIGERAHAAAARALEDAAEDGKSPEDQSHLAMSTAVTEGLNMLAHGSTTEDVLASIPEEAMLHMASKVSATVAERESHLEDSSPAKDEAQQLSMGSGFADDKGLSKGNSSDEEGAVFMHIKAGVTLRACILCMSGSGDKAVPAEQAPLPLSEPGNPCPGGCGRCEGDCDNDGQCKAGLTCFQRSGFTPVPGCSGQGKAHWDYCI